MGRIGTPISVFLGLPVKLLSACWERTLRPCGSPGCTLALRKVLQPILQLMMEDLPFQDHRGLEVIQSWRLYSSLSRPMASRDWNCTLTASFAQRYRYDYYQYSLPHILSNSDKWIHVVHADVKQNYKESRALR